MKNPFNKNEEIIFNSDSEVNEIFKSNDLETYLILKRKVKFDDQDNTKKIDMKFDKNKIIGFIYNIKDFNIEKYWRRTEEKYNKKMELKKSFKELKIKEIEEREKTKKKMENYKK